MRGAERTGVSGCRRRPVGLPEGGKMLPIGPLMIEHRLIIKVIGVMERLAQSAAPDPGQVSAVVDFMRTYGDRTHHGKEEDILFKALLEKDLSPDDRASMDDLGQEHAIARGLVRELEAANRPVQRGTPVSSGMADLLARLARLYPEHIRKEDKVFFPACVHYFSPEENQAMLASMASFDQHMIHEKYKAVAAALLEEQA